MALIKGAGDVFVHAASALLPVGAGVGLLTHMAGSDRGTQTFLRASRTGSGYPDKKPADPGKITDFFKSKKLRQPDAQSVPQPTETMEIDTRDNSGTDSPTINIPGIHRTPLQFEWEYPFEMATLVNDHIDPPEPTVPDKEKADTVLPALVENMAKISSGMMVKLQHNLAKMARRSQRVRYKKAPARRTYRRVYRPRRYSRKTYRRRRY